MSWQEVKLDSVISFIRGVTFKPADQVESFSTGSVVVMRTKNVQVEGLQVDDLIAVDLRFVKRKEQFLKSGDILISSANSWELVGKVSLVENLGYVATAGGFISIVRANPDVLFSKYLYYWLSSPRTQHVIRHLGRQTTNISNLDVNRFKELSFPLPPLTEQKRIAAILDKADQLRQKRQQAIALADDFLRSVFLDMFGDLAFNPYDYQRVSLDSLSVNDGIKCGPFGTQLGKHEYLAEGVPLWGIKHVNRDFKVETDEYLSAPKAIALKAYSIRPDDIVMTRKGTVGNCHVYPEHMPEGIMHSDLLRIRVDESIIDPYFLSWQLKLSRDVSHQISLISSGAIMAGINVTKLKNIEVYVPEVTQQIKFREILFKKGELTQEYSQGDLALFDALSQKAFAGEL